ncbi:hypothetical protein BX600DRAFT_443528 [Xylariales sp. PMI_506]|nr:hypothetical protein BX600DRAFT_443528 [Xylariales sp. PMI_506]
MSGLSTQTILERTRYTTTVTNTGSDYVTEEVLVVISTGFEVLVWDTTKFPNYPISTSTGIGFATTSTVTDFNAVVATDAMVTPKAQHHLSPGAISGITVACVVGLFMAGVLAWLAIRRAAKRKGKLLRDGENSVNTEKFGYETPKFLGSDAAKPSPPVYHKS